MFPLCSLWIIGGLDNSGAHFKAKNKKPPPPFFSVDAGWGVLSARLEINDFKRAQEYGERAKEKYLQKSSKKNSNEVPNA